MVLGLRHAPRTNRVDGSQASVGGGMTGAHRAGSVMRVAGIILSGVACSGGWVYLFRH